jgi:hypothetical protein
MTREKTIINAVDGNIGVRRCFEDAISCSVRWRGGYAAGVFIFGALLLLLICPCSWAQLTPDTIIIGSNKGGSDTLYGPLKDNEHLFLESNFFMDFELNRNGIQSVDPRIDLNNDSGSIYNLDNGEIYLFTGKTYSFSIYNNGRETSIVPTEIINWRTDTLMAGATPAGNKDCGVITVRRHDTAYAGILALHTPGEVHYFQQAKFVRTSPTAVLKNKNIISLVKKVAYISFRRRKTEAGK